VQYIPPNYFGYALEDRISASDNPIFARLGQTVQHVRDTAGVKFIALCCGFWYEWSVAMGESWLGFDIKNLRVTLYGDGNTRINMSTWELCGRAVAQLLPCLWKNRGMSRR
jgi:hypothetical protein